MGNGACMAIYCTTEFKFIGGNMTGNKEIDKWLSEMSTYLINSWGLDISFSSQVALLYLYFFYYGLSPVITSGFRDPAYQKQLHDRWEAGDKSIVVEPAVNSKHSYVKLGKPSALAIDISTNNHFKASQIAKALNIKAGYDFKTSDPVHFYI